jgi:hypothetical protein
MIPITSHFPTDSQFERDLYASPILHAIEKQYDGSLFNWNGILLHVAITACVDLGYAIMRIPGYIAAQTEVVLKALEHTLRYLYFYRHMSIFYLRHLLSRKALVMHWTKGSPEYGMMLVN